MATGESQPEHTFVASVGRLVGVAVLSWKFFLVSKGHSPA
jgi:hypothetical protein